MFINKYYPSIVLILLVYQTKTPIILLYFVTRLANYILKKYIKQERPPETATRLKSYGMPSDHAQTAAFFFMTQYIQGNRYWPMSFLMSVEVSMSRVHGGYHTPAQVFVGYLIGLLIGSISWFYSSGVRAVS